MFEEDKQTCLKPDQETFYSLSSPNLDSPILHQGPSGYLFCQLHAEVLEMRVVGGYQLDGDNLTAKTRTKSGVNLKLCFLLGVYTIPFQQQFVKEVMFYNQT